MFIVVDFVVFFLGFCLFNSLGYGVVMCFWKLEGYDICDNFENVKYDQWKCFVYMGKISLKWNYGYKII